MVRRIGRFSGGIVSAFASSRENSSQSIVLCHGPAVSHSVSIFRSSIKLVDRPVKDPLSHLLHFDIADLFLGRTPASLGMDNYYDNMPGPGKSFSATVKAITRSPYVSFLPYPSPWVTSNRFLLTSLRLQFFEEKFCSQ